MSDLDRLFRHLVHTLGQADPGLEYQPVTLAELLDHLIPYRTSRRVVGIDSSEDYELLMLRLASGEEGLVVTEPETARIRFAEEARSPNPDLHVLRELGAATLRPTASAMSQAMVSPEQDAAFLPPPPVLELDIPKTPVPAPAPRASAPPRVPVSPPPSPPPPLRATAPPAPRPATPAAPAFCGSCGGKLPAGREVMFCPFCGRSFRDANCPKCGAEVEAGWKHCVGCGATL